MKVNAMKKIAFFVLIVLLLFAINNLVHSIFTLWHKQELMTKAQNELKKVKKENTELAKQIKKIEDPQFVEQEARNKLLLARPGEQILVPPKNLAPSTKPKEIKQPEKKQNWQEWLGLFTKN